MKIKFLELGKQPIANNFIEIGSKNQEKEFFFDLNVTFDTSNFLVSLENFVLPELMFNESYVYHSSQSQTMREHFKNAANKFKSNFKVDSIVEIGSNDGVFLFNFENSNAVAVEPCSNFANLTSEKGYKTYSEFWTYDLSKKIKQSSGCVDLVYSANCMCHIQDLKNTFDAVENILNDDGVFIFEDPSLLKMINRNSYDQIYDEHAHIFSILSLNNVLNKSNLEIFDVENLAVHGGSNRVYACRKGTRKIEETVYREIAVERSAGLDKIETFEDFARRVEKSKVELVNILKDYKSKGLKIVSYGATSKSTTVFNYCKIDDSIIDYIIDTTPAKQNKLSPGMHIPVFSDKMFDETVDVAFLGAWNFFKEIIKKEKPFIERGGVFVTHVPSVKVIEKEK